LSRSPITTRNRDQANHAQNKTVATPATIGAQADRHRSGDGRTGRQDSLPLHAERVLTATTGG
jgi:hypothetical protein